MKRELLQDIVSPFKNVLKRNKSRTLRLNDLEITENLETIHMHNMSKAHLQKYEND